jgi:uncharacterized protein GlcG (DUF336 family)
MLATRLVHDLTREAALQMASLAHAAARREGIAIAVAIVDRGGHIILVDRMDGAAACAVPLAVSKAETAVMTLAPTRTWFDSTQPGRADWGMNLALAGRFNAMPGGAPISIAGDIVGGLGVSGGEASQDVACASAALEGFEDCA